jgi:hypothetical protein
MDGDVVVSTKTMAQLVGVHPRTLMRLARSEADCPAYRLGPRPRGPRQATLGWLQARGRGAVAQPPADPRQLRLPGTSDPRPPLVEALKVVLGSGEMSLDEMLAALNERGWGLVTTYPRSFLVTFLTDNRASFEGGNDRYRVRQNPPRVSR